ncbi:MAG TPA: hypothetical protein VFB10_05710 [Candidatus Dormibacteraeota bacterium]|nr:hypothetical protein [Candidatus Dormibacteraeota bacterium]
MQCKELEAVLEHEGLTPLPPAARAHLAECSACQGFLADLTTIQSLAHELPAESTPPDRLWISLRAQLTAEGVIKESVELSHATPWWQSFTAWLKPRTLATAGAGIVLVVTAVFLSRNPISQPVARISYSPVSSRATSTVAPPAGPPVESSSKTPRPSPTEEAMANGGLVLNQAELDVPNMQLAGNSTVDASLRDNLRTVNEFIAECQQHLKQHPGDLLAREYLESAYQQKAELLAAMMDSGRSEH